MEFWDLVTVSGISCYSFRNPEREVATPWQTLEVTLSLNKSNAASIAHDAFALTVLFSEPDRKPSIYTTSQLHVMPGHHYHLALNVFEYKDSSSKSDCVPRDAPGILVFDGGYSYNYCLDECKTLHERQFCGCDVGVSSHQGVDGFDICGVFDMLFCQKDLSLGQTLSDIENLPEI